MDREFMLAMLEKRITELKQMYRGFVREWDVKKNCSVSRHYANVRRANVKKELEVCKLVQYLLQHTDIPFLESPDAVSGFQKLVEPRDCSRR